MTTSSFASSLRPHDVKVAVRGELVALRLYNQISIYKGCRLSDQFLTIMAVNWLLVQLVLLLASFCAPLPCRATSPVIFSADPSVDPNTAGSDTGSYWYELNTDGAAFSGFCLTEAQGRVLRDWRQPLYNLTVTLTPAFPHTFNVLGTWVAKLLLEETLGYQVWIHDVPNDINDEYQNIALGFADAAVTVYREPTADGPEYAQYVEQQQTLVSLGDHTVQARAGWYVPHQQVLDNPTLSLELWRSYMSGPEGLGDQVIPLLFLNDTWAALDSGLLLLQDPSDNSSFVCPSDAVLEAQNGGSTAADCGCENGIYYPPQCLPNPRQQCGLVYMPNTYFDSGIAQNVVRNLNLRLAVAFITNYTQTVETLLSTNTTFLFYSQYIDLTVQRRCVMTGTGLLDTCFSRIFLPTYDVSCDALTDGSYRGNYTCDYAFQDLIKIGASQLLNDLPRAGELLSALLFAPVDAEQLLANILKQENALLSSTVPDYKRAACDWLQANTDTWMTWVPSPAPCTYADMQYQLSGCTSTAPLYTVGVSWLQPKACVGGLSLPDSPVSTSCGSTDSEAQITALTFMVAFLVLVTAIWAQWLRSVCSTAARERSDIMSSKTPIPLAAAVLRLQRMLLSVWGTVGLTLQWAGLLLLGGALVVNAAWETGPVQCASRAPLLLMGLVCLGLGQWWSWRQFMHSVRFRLQTLNTNWRMVSVLAAVLAANVVVLAAMAVENEPSVTSRTSIVAGFVPVSVYYCNTLSSSYAYPLLAVNASWFVVGFGDVTRFAVSLLVRWLRHCDEEKSSPLRSSKDRSTLKGRQRFQLTSIMIAQVAWSWLVVSLLLSLSSTSLSEDNQWTVRFQGIAVDIGVALLLTAWFAPAARLAWRIVRQGTNPRAAAVTTNVHVHKRTGSINRSTTLSAGNGTVNSRHISQVSLGTDTNELVHDPVILACLTEFMETTFDAETAKFLTEYLELEEQISGHSTVSCAVLLVRVEALHDRYISPDSESPVNISGAQVKQVQHELEALKNMCRTKQSQVASPDVRQQCRSCFASVVQESIELLRVNGIPRFLSSSYSERANEILDWADRFEDWSTTQKKALLRRWQSQEAHSAVKPTVTGQVPRGIWQSHSTSLSVQPKHNSSIASVAPVVQAEGRIRALTADR